MKKQDLVFAITGAYGFCGGIAVTNRNTLYALFELVKEFDIGLTIFSLCEVKK